MKHLSMLCAAIVLLVVPRSGAQETLRINTGFPVLRLAWSHDGNTIATARHGTIRLWDAKTGEEAGTLVGHEDTTPKGKAFTTENILGLAFHPKGGILASAGYDKTARIWDLETKKPLHVLEAHADRIFFVFFEPGGERFGTSSLLDRKPETKIWDAKTGKEVRTLKDAYGRTFNYDGKQIVGTEGGNVHFWDVETGRKLSTFKTFVGPASHVGVSADGRRVAGGHSNGIVTVWDTMTGNIALLLKGHGGPVNAVCFSPNNKYIAVASGFPGASPVFKPGDDKKKGDPKPLGPLDLKVWEASSGKLLRQFKGHWNAVQQVQFSPDGTRLASASYDGTVRVWKMD